MIKANKDRLTVSGEIDVVMAEFMCIVAYMAETFGMADMLNMVEGVLEEMEGEG